MNRSKKEEEENDVDLVEDQEEEEDVDLDDEDDDDDDEDDEDDDDDDDDDDEDDKDESDEAENSNKSDEKMDTISEEEFNTKFNALKSAIDENPLHYDGYVEIIKLLRNNGELNLLREYRTKMRNIYPLTESKS